MILPGGHGMVYGMAWRCTARYIVWPGRHGMVYDNAWYGMECEFHVLWHYLGLWSHSHVEKQMLVGGPVHMYRTQS